MNASQRTHCALHFSCGHCIFNKTFNDLNWVTVLYMAPSLFHVTSVMNCGECTNLWQIQLLTDTELLANHLCPHGVFRLMPDYTCNRDFSDGAHNSTQLKRGLPQLTNGFPCAKSEKTRINLLKHVNCIRHVSRLNYRNIQNQYFPIYLFFFVESVTHLQTLLAKLIYSRQRSI